MSGKDEKTPSLTDVVRAAFDGYMPLTRLYRQGDNLTLMVMRGSIEQFPDYRTRLSDLGEKLPVGGVDLAVVADRLPFTSVEDGALYWEDAIGNLYEGYGGYGGREVLRWVNVEVARVGHTRFTKRVPA